MKLRLGLFLALSLPARSAQLTLEPAWMGPKDAPPAALVVKVISATPGAPAVATLEQPLASRGPTPLTLPAGDWWVVVEGPDAWALYQRAQLGPEGAQLRVPVWPGGRVEGTLRMPPGEPLPPEVKLRFALAPGDPTAEARRPEPALLRCKVLPEGKRFECRVPAFTLDLGLRAEGYATHHRWDLPVPHGQVVKVGELTLEKGASVVGWVATEDGSALSPSATATLEPAGLATPLETAPPARSELVRRKAPIHERGFFHFDGVAPGEYVVTARQEPFGPASATVRVLENLEAELAGPLLLAKPETLALEIHPPQDPSGFPWRVLVHKSDRRRNRGERVREVELPPDGFGRIEGLPRGSYLVKVLGSTSKTWALEPVELGTDPMPVSLTLEPVEVRGRVLLGGEPAVAQVYFGGRWGGVQMDLSSDEEGRFSGLLPRPGEWDVDVDAKEPKVKVSLGKVLVEPEPGKAFAEVTLELPDTRLALLVVDESDRPVERALVTVDPVDPIAIPGASQERTDEGGLLELRGLAEGPYFATASGREGSSSDHVPVSVREGGAAPPVKLKLRRLRRLRVRVEGPGGPIPGARLLVFPAGAAFASGPLPLTEANGEAELQLQPGSGWVDTLVHAPGLAAALGRRALPDEGAPLVLQLSREGGTLLLGASVPSNGLRPTAVLLHGGMATPWSALPVVISEARGSGVLGERLSLPLIEPGSYALCPVAPGTPLPSEPHAGCASGVLAPGGTLELALPSQR